MKYVIKTNTIHALCFIRTSFKYIEKKLSKKQPKNNNRLK